MNSQIRVSAIFSTACLVGASIANAQFGPTYVTFGKVVEQDVSAGHTFVGTVMPVRRSIVGSAVDGRVIDFPVNEGDDVAEGEPLAQLRTETLKIELAAAEAARDALFQRLAVLKAGTREEDKRRAQALARVAEALADYTTSKLERTRALAETKSASEDELQDAISKHEQALATYDAAKAAWDLALAGPRTEEILEAEASLKSQEEEVRRIQDQIDKHTIVSPFAGYVVREHTEVGQWVARGAPVAEIVEIGDVHIEVQVLESHVAQLAVGTPARIECASVTDRTLTGEVAIVVPQADLRSRNVPIKVRVANDDRLLMPGMFARVTLPVGRPGKTLLAPKDALVLGGATPVLMVFKPSAGSATGPRKGTVERVPVELGVAYDGLIEVRGAIEAGAEIVIEGNERLRPGQEVVERPKSDATAATSTAAP